MAGARKSKVCGRKKVRKQRVAKRSILFFGEGPTEKAFLDYLHSVYASRKSDKTVHRGAASGGSHVDTVLGALNYKAHSIDVDKIHILLDEDCKAEPCEQVMSKARQKLRGNATRRKVPVVCHYSVPLCIEGFFLELLEGKAPNNSESCKKRFEERYLSAREKLVKGNYARVFPLSALNAYRKQSPLLDEIIEVFE